MARGYERLKREIELKRLRTFATIEYMRDGGPIIDLITGSEPHPVGAKVCIKAGMRALQWETYRAERPMIELCEVASPVKKFLTQPHELFMKVTGQSEEWMYRPDFRLTVDAKVLADFRNNVPFSTALAQWQPAHRTHDVTLIIEVKDNTYSRIDDPLYARKLELAQQVYESINWHFITLLSSRDIDNAHVEKSVRQIFLDHDVSLSGDDLDTARDVFQHHATPMLIELVLAFGGGAVGRGKCSALHARRVFSIDLRHDLRAEAPVRQLPDDMAIFELPGRHPW